jgi:multisubunit Na+/H+ antiporter MnhB subunit
MPVDTWIVFILGFMILGSIVALEIRDILSSIIAIGIVGLGVSMAFLFLQAPDLAIVQFLFEIFALVILIRAFITRGVHEQSPGRFNTMLVLVTLVALVLIFVVSIPVFKALPVFGEPIMSTARYYLDHAAEQTGAANIVSAIILDYRAYDTLGEITVLFTAILGTLSVLRLQRRSKDQQKEGTHEN